MISALSCHGNPLHPDRAAAQEYDRVYRDTVRLASELGVEVVNLFSGCPGDSDNATYPNWVTCAWPPDFEHLLKWQWEEKAIPYWQEAGRFAEERGVRLAFEMRPGFLVYNPETLLRLCAAVGPVIGANYDPSHLFWQGIEPERFAGMYKEQDAWFNSIKNGAELVIKPEQAYMVTRMLEAIYQSAQTGDRPIRKM